MHIMDLSATTLRTTIVLIVVCVLDSTYGRDLWSSSELFREYARGLNTHNGYVYYLSKDYTNTYRRVRA